MVCSNGRPKSSYGLDFPKGRKYISFQTLEEERGLIRGQEEGMNQQQYKMMKVLQKVTIFKGCDVSEAEHLLRRCFLQTYEVGQEIYRADEASEEMLILLNGQLAVTSKAGEALGKIVAGTSTGEMGFFTGEPRSANVTASVQSTGLVLRKSVLQALLQEDYKIHVKVLRNVLALLSELAGTCKHAD